MVGERFVKPEKYHSTMQILYDMSEDARREAGITDEMMESYRGARRIGRDKKARFEVPKSFGAAQQVANQYLAENTTDLDKKRSILDRCGGIDTTECDTLENRAIQEAADVGIHAAKK